MKLNFVIDTLRIDGMLVAKMSMISHGNFKYEYAQAFPDESVFVNKLGQFVESGAISMRKYIDSLESDELLDILR